MITRETDYAIRLLRTLRDRERHTVAEAAERELVPQPFAYKILKKLSKAGLVEVLRGVDVAAACWRSWIRSPCTT